MNKLSLILLFTIFGFSLNAQFISAVDGNYNDPVTWGGMVGDPVLVPVMM